ncbi:MAG: VWA domain-containing protein, partial [Actinomycetota bacterium]
METHARPPGRGARALAVVAALWLLALGSIGPAAAQDEPSASLLIVLDASGSMQAKLGNTTRIAAARAGLRALVSDLPEDSLVGLRVYGHRFAGNRARGCADTQLVVPVKRLDRRRLL